MANDYLAIGADVDEHSQLVGLVHLHGHDAGCDVCTNESVEAAKKIIEIWEGFNLADVPMLSGLTSQEILSTIDKLKKYVNHGEKNTLCVSRGCYASGGSIGRCPIWKCVKSKGYWTCAECEEYDVESKSPCPHPEENFPGLPLSSRGVATELVCKRYASNNIENLKRCREIGYPAFVEEIKEKVEKGWRTWQVISKEMIVSKIWTF